MIYLVKLDETNLVGYSDANSAPNGDWKSQTGGLVKLTGSSITNVRRKQTTVLQSTIEAEYLALAVVSKRSLYGCKNWWENSPS